MYTQITVKYTDPSQNLSGFGPIACQRSIRFVEKAPLPLARARLEHQLEAAAGGRFKGPLGVGFKAVVLQAATGRCKREGARAHATHPWAKEGVAAVHAGCAGVGGSGEGVGAAASK